MLSALAYKKGQGEFLIMKQFMKEYGGSLIIVVTAILVFMLIGWTTGSSNTAVGAANALSEVQSTERADMVNVALTTAKPTIEYVAGKNYPSYGNVFHVYQSDAVSTYAYDLKKMFEAFDADGNVLEPEIESVIYLGDPARTNLAETKDVENFLFEKKGTYLIKAYCVGVHDVTAKSEITVPVGKR